MAHVITSRERDIGGFSVRRLLPAVGRKMVGPFIFFDHMGPATFAPTQGMDVRPHPHIGLATVTFLFEGAILHRDSLGFVQEIRPGDVNWMIAGSGIVHSERTPPSLRQTGSRVEGIQCWIALPQSDEETAPAFFHHPAATLPEFKIGDVTLRLLAGSAFERQSPVRTFSDLLYLDVNMPAGAQLTVPAGERELGVYLARGSVLLGEEPLAAKSLAVGKVGEDLSIKAEAASRLMLLGGTPLSEDREIWWNFVSSSKARLARAKVDWKAGRFGTIPGDDQEFIPLPAETPVTPPGTVL